MAKGRYLQFQQALTDSAEDELRSLAGPLPAEIKRYQQRFEQSFSTSPHPSLLSSLIREVRTHRYVLVGDYHSSSAYQFSFVQLLEKSIHNQQRGEHSPAPHAVVLECFSAEDDALLEQYQSGKLEEKEFLRQVQWEKTWGFPWSPLRKTLTLCQRWNVPVFGLRSELPAEKNSLLDQDQSMAKRLHALRERHPHVHHWFVLVGDWHLAPAHLPKQMTLIAPQDRSLIVHQGVNKVYWALAQKKQERRVSIVQISPSRFTLNTSTPWLKTQSYVQWLKKKNDHEEELIDHDDDLAQTVHQLTDFLNLPKILNLDHFTIYVGSPHPLLEHLEKKKLFDSQQKQKLLRTLQQRAWFFMPKEKILYLKSSHATLRGAAAMKLIHSCYTDDQETYPSNAEDLYRFILLEAASYFGAKLLDHRLRSPRAKTLVAVAPPEMSSDTALEWLSRELGCRLGERLFQLSPENPVVLALLRAILTTPEKPVSAVHALYRKCVKATEAKTLKKQRRRQPRAS